MVSPYNEPEQVPYYHIRQWIEGSDEGVILFSLGTNLLSSSIPPELLNAILETFRNIKQRVIWKWDTDVMPNKPDNVMLVEWLPQDDILAHPNVRLFIMHCGLGGIAEALFHGVPIVGIPMFGDQPVNLAQVEKEGWAYVLQYTELTVETFSKAVTEVLHNPRYRESVKRISQLFRDRPQTAMDTAIFWTEYEIRHKGAYRLRYPGMDMNFIQRLSCRWCCRRRVTKVKIQQFPLNGSFSSSSLKKYVVIKDVENSVLALCHINCEIARVLFRTRTCTVPDCA
ncbi:UDP-glycosyltransferase UGT5-like [Anopheles maculipalpis]|uniref:UDP-glycosyltransferase UGT5-like n=1 Tax=Anopheles maculipalpis TaxID=1496333 RepID=UPI00215968E0|nr:UDP-glycosyltransferase UGT5-like [Anopheles maculipalpis]